MTIVNDHGLFVEEGDPPRCVGFIFNFPGRGSFAPNGKVGEFTKEQVDEHNRRLGAAEIAGLDQCAIGQCGMFYAKQNATPVRSTGLSTVYLWTVSTWDGQIVVDNAVQVSNRTLKFRRHGRYFRVYLRKDADLARVKRIA